MLWQVAPTGRRKTPVAEAQLSLAGLSIWPYGSAGVWGKSIEPYAESYEVSAPSTDHPRRDASGRFLEPPRWLRSGWSHVIATGFGTGGPGRKACARVGCRGTAPRFSEFCWHHDKARRHARLEQLRTGRGKRPSPSESARLYRSDAKRLWMRAPWWPAATIWLSPALEADFIKDCQHAGLTPAEIAPAILNTLRWSWRRNILDRSNNAGWERSLAVARKHQAKIGEPPENYVYMPSSQTRRPMFASSGSRGARRASSSRGRPTSIEPRRPRNAAHVHAHARKRRQPLSMKTRSSSRIGATSSI